MLTLAGCASAGADPGASAATPPAAAPTPPAITACFVPGQDCEAVIVAELGRAHTEILVQAYGFTSRPIAAALVAASGRGVDVRVLLDKSDRHARGSQIATIAGAGIPVLIDTVPGIAHNKVIVVDGATVITGSFNFTWSADNRNAENLVVIRDPAIAGDYRDNWMKRQAASIPP